MESAAGIQTMGTCSQNLTHVMLELGGNDAFIFLEDGDMDLAIKKPFGEDYIMVDKYVVQVRDF